MTEQFLENIQTRSEMFSFEDKKVTTIERDLLAKSSMLLDSRGNALKTRPVQAWTLLNDIEEIMRENDIVGHLDPIWLQGNGANPILTQEDREKYDRKNAPIDRWVFQDIITRFNMPFAEDKQGETGRNIAVSICFHKKGITISWGLNERICSNFQILSRKNILHTFGGDNRMDYNSIKLQLADWMRKFEDKRAIEMETVDKMMNTIVPGNDVIDKLIGKLYRKAVQQAYGSKEQAPFSINSMSQFVQNIDLRKNNVQDILQENPSVYDIYNFGTGVMKPGMIDISDIIEVSGMFAEFLLDEFQLN